MTRPTSPGGKFTLSLIVGLLLIPASAVAAFMVVSGETPNEARTETIQSEPTTTTRVASQAELIINPVTASEADIVAACGSDGQSLVELESSDQISNIQQAALDALRSICSKEGMPLPEPPAPPPIIRTLKRTATTSGQSVDREDEATHDDDDDDDDHEEYGSESDYLATHAAAVAAINTAVDAGGKGEKIDEARKKLSESEAKAAQEDWKDASEKAREAIHKAKESVEDDD